MVSIIPSDRAAALVDPNQLPSIAEEYNLRPAQTAHRINVLRSSGIQNGDRILEIGCGQGDCTSALAMIFPESQIDAIDPGALDYGTPETLGQAQERIKTYDFGSRITFHQAIPKHFLAGVQNATYDVAVFCHCLWYFASQQEYRSTFEAARGKVKKLFIAEWGLESSTEEGRVHVSAALTRAACEARIHSSTENIRSPGTPATIKDLAKEAGVGCMEEGWFVPETELEDARREIGSVVKQDGDGSSAFLKRSRDKGVDEVGYEMLENMLGTVKSALEGVGGMGSVRCMDVWWGWFE
ncbi:hypothetical protein P280DRAFT_472792 [Massarina eburnea CBS 473.64]|uniref:Methyltransferase domain-containing protein n=1 Tax=Massarina eburnea CBS 473.64 TaxID=1395130 RepID=A0A6A6RN44_9PLEO|nr:hypothetical protein P280DRAFT_472792 [Massarina eburnea CBS 473.64]